MDFPKLIAQLKEHEGTGPKKGKFYFPYKDTVGKLTIGIGHNLDDRGLSEHIVQMILEEDIEEHLAELRSHLPWFDSLDEVRQRVLADMAFNLGVAGLLGFKKTLSAIRDGEYHRASVMMLQSKWAEQVGRRALRLAEMMRTGEDV